MTTSNETSVTEELIDLRRRYPDGRAPSAVHVSLHRSKPSYLRSLGSLQVTRDGNIAETSAPLAEVLTPDANLVGRNVFDIVSPEFGVQIREAMVELDENSSRVVQFEGTVAFEATQDSPGPKAPRPVRIEMSCHPSEDRIVVAVAEPEGSADGGAGELRTDEQFRMLAETLPVGVFVLSKLGPITFANQTLHTIYGVDTLEGFDWLEAVHPEDRSHVESVMARLRFDRLIDTKLRLLTPAGETRWCRLAARDLRDEAGSLNSIVGLIEDITEIRSLQNRLERQASTDALTSLPNRATLLDHLETSLATESSSAGFTAVLFIDLDGFKLINDTQGHSVGDILLQSVAQRFAGSLRPGDLIARFGGDEFVVVAQNVTDPSIAEAVAQRLHDVLQAPVMVHNQPLTTTASIGVALSNNGGIHADELLGDADLAMYEAKRLGRRRTVMYDLGLREAASQRFDIITDLAHARDRRELRAEYQPIYDMETGLACGAEALIRWDHPSHGHLLPGTFISLAEENGLVADLGDWMVEQACSDLARLRYNGLVDSEFFVTVNISTMQLSHLNDLAATARDALATYGLRPHDLVFELTESIPVDAIPEAAALIRQLKSEGFRLAIDDFGTGYSSLEYLTMLPFDMMKIDPTFMARMVESSSASAVLESIVVMAERIGFAVIAEGIESEATRDLAAAVGVRYGQGYHYCRPQPIDRLMRTLSLVKQPAS